VSGPEVISAIWGPSTAFGWRLTSLRMTASLITGALITALLYGVSYNGSLMDSRVVVVFASSHGDTALGVALGRGIVGRETFQLILRDVKLQWGTPDSCGKACEFDLAAGVGASFEIELADSAEAVSDVDLDGGGVDGLGVDIVDG